MADGAHALTDVLPPACAYRGRGVSPVRTHLVITTSDPLPAFPVEMPLYDLPDDTAEPKVTQS